MLIESKVSPMPLYTRQTLLIHAVENMLRVNEHGARLLVRVHRKDMRWFGSLIDVCGWKLFTLDGNYSDLVAYTITKEQVMGGEPEFPPPSDDRFFNVSVCSWQNPLAVKVPRVIEADSPEQAALLFQEKHPAMKDGDQILVQVPGEIGTVGRLFEPLTPTS